MKRQGVWKDGRAGVSSAPNHMKIEPFRNEDHAAVLRLRDETFAPLALDTFLWQPCQQVESLEKDCAKYVAREGEVVGYGAAYRLDETHFRLNLLVTPRLTRRGAGTLLLGKVEAEVRRARGRYLQARVIESTESGLHFARRRGFREVHRMRGMTLAAHDFDYRRWEGLSSRLRARGFSLATLAGEEAEGRAPLDRLVALQLRAREGWPSPDPTQEGGASSAEEVRGMFSGVTEPAGFVVAMYGDEYVGYTSPQGGAGTAVHPDYRNLGVAKFMKSYALKLGIEAGRRRFDTCSASPWMQRVNEQLGYKFNGLVEVRFFKDLGAA